MVILFRVEKENDKVVKVLPLFPNNDTSYHQMSLKTIKNTLQDLVEEFNTTNRDILFISLYAGNYEFCDVFHGEEFQILVRMKNGFPDKILKVDETCYGMSDIHDLLNSENRDPEISYELFNVRGELK